MSILKELLKTQVSEMIHAPDGALYSIDPPETLFGALYFSHMIPPFKPESSLILGYGEGTVANLMRKIWGNDIMVTGVDVQKYDWKFVEYKMKVMDAYEYVKDCTDSIFKTKFDYICVDVWDGKKCQDFVFWPEFAVRLKEMCKKMVCINTEADRFKDLRGFYDYGFEFERHTQIDGNIVSWWSVVDSK